MLRISGPDAYTYLQGQFTQDLNAPVGFARYGLWLNQKGRVIADSTILRRDAAEFLVVSRSANAQILRERLESYLIADEVAITDQTHEYASVAVWGSGSSELSKELLGAKVAVGNFAANARGWLVFSPRGLDEQYFELWLPCTDIELVQQQLIERGAVSASVADFQRARLESGIPAIPADIGASDLPNEGGLDEIAISYTKGCYLGQEVMARLKNLGQVRRRLHVVRGRGPTPDAPAPLFQGERKIGELRSVVATNEEFVAMAMLSLLNLDAARGLSLAIGAEPGISVVRRV